MPIALLDKSIGRAPDLVHAGAAYGGSLEFRKTGVLEGAQKRGRSADITGYIRPLTKILFEVEQKERGVNDQGIISGGSDELEQNWFSPCRARRPATLAADQRSSLGSKSQLYALDRSREGKSEQRKHNG
jgi:hypothetical protein